eukprot:CAMPEP_0172325068 /NCGR_PEP_ID=MMETSP1058-20130122/53051_1 /TAXON_ID=83371 /ORGANISM="Detonula confervacea, Strain CCMP 353" /LENGTH=839 /DNA_ID=CAMNT_0013041517 /DNA_START=272 /DNA_END=2789 /DNA_ORIENTATION=-
MVKKEDDTEDHVDGNPNSKLTTVMHEREFHCADESDNAPVMVKQEDDNVDSNSNSDQSGGGLDFAESISNGDYAKVAVKQESDTQDDVGSSTDAGQSLLSTTANSGFAVEDIAHDNDNDTGTEQNSDDAAEIALEAVVAIEECEIQDDVGNSADAEQLLSTATNTNSGFAVEDMSHSNNNGTGTEQNSNVAAEIALKAIVAIGESEIQGDVGNSADDEQLLNMTANNGFAVGGIMPHGNDNGTGTEQNNDDAAEIALKAVLAINVDTLSSDDLKQKIRMMQKICTGNDNDVMSMIHADNDPTVQDPANQDVFDENYVKVKKKLGIERKKSEASRSKRSRGGEIGRLQDHLVPGLHDHAPNAVPRTLKNKGSPSVRRHGKSRRMSKEAIKIMPWNATESGLVSSNPIHYCNVPERISTIAGEVKKEILQHLGRGLKKYASEMIDYAEEVETGSGYFRAHLKHSYVTQRLPGILPDRFQVKQSASQKEMVFLNTSDGQCHCHFDRDSSALFLVSGYKEVKIASPMDSLARPADGNLHHVDPFSPNEEDHGAFNWETVHLGPGSVLFIPKYWLHCIRSIGTPNTLAFSFQVELNGGARWSQNAFIAREPTTAPVAGITASGDYTAHCLDISNNTASESAREEAEEKAKLKDDNGKTKHKRKLGRSIKVDVDEQGVRDKKKLRPKEEHRSDRIKEENSTSRQPLCRKSSRTLPKCGMLWCSKGFCNEEMWVLQLKFAGRADLPDCPTAVPKHLICMKCCPRNELKATGDPEKEITYPDGKRRSILTRDEFCETSNMERSDLQHYEYASSSYIDYTTKFVNQGRSLYGHAGGKYDAGLAEISMI